MRRLFQWAVGLAAGRLIDDGFDYLLHPFCVFYFGPILGGLFVAGASATVCFAILRFYDWSKVDWFAIETIRSWKNYAGRNLLRRAIAAGLNLPKPFAFALLSIRCDPFTVTVFFREGEFSGMARRDWRHFWGSIIIGNIYWTVVCYVGIESIRRIWS